MEIAIKADPSRGKKIISLLESLGGINRTNLIGDGLLNTYYIDENNIIRHGYAPTDYKEYTLEEFEREFPFKIGDIVALNGINKPHEIIALEFYVNKLCYKLDNGFHFSPRALTIYGEMKEERNITLTLDKAKEWYKKGGDLKQVALQAFTEKELNPLPRNWEEFYEQYKFKSNLNACLNVIGFNFSIKYANKFKAFVKLQYLRDCWRQGWEPTTYDTGYCIIRYPTKYLIMRFCFISFLSFPTKEMAEEFLKCFKDLIEQAGDLI